MKRLLTIFLLSVITLSCTGDIEPVDPSIITDLNNPIITSFKAEINGIPYDPGVVNASVGIESLSISTISGTETLQLGVSDLALGTFIADVFSGNNQAFIRYTNSLGNLYYLSDTGSITITNIDEVNQKITGAFNGVLKETNGAAPDVAITNGIFQNIAYCTDACLDSGNAIIDGNQFIASDLYFIEFNNMIGVTLENGINEKLGLWFPADIVAGTYPIENYVNGTYTAFYINDITGLNNTSIGGSGSIIITDRTNDVLTGTFSFTAVDPNNPSLLYQVTDGNFVLNIQ